MSPQGAWGASGPPCEVVVDASHVVRELPSNPTGFCMSFLTDGDHSGQKPFADVLSPMHPGSLHYPMGTLAENYLFHDLATGEPTTGPLAAAHHQPIEAAGRLGLGGASGRIICAGDSRLRPVHGTLPQDQRGARGAGGHLWPPLSQGDDRRKGALPQCRTMGAICQCDLSLRCALLGNRQRSRPERRASGYAHASNTCESTAS